MMGKVRKNGNAFLASNRRRCCFYQPLLIPLRPLGSDVVDGLAAAGEATVLNRVPIRKNASRID
jgi:hypothetical protein